MIPPRTFQPYRTATLETPVFHLILEPFCLPCLRRLLALIYQVRWMMSHPMRVPIVPRFFRRSATNVPTSVWLSNLTIGDLLLFLPLAMFLLLCYHYTFVAVSVTDNGRMASYAIYLTFLTASKSNSLFSFLFGISFERMIPLHYLASLVAVACGCMHVYIAFEYGGDNDGDSKYVGYGDDPNFVKFLWDGDTNVSGSLLLGSMMISVALSFFPLVRRIFFNVWYGTHMLLGFLTIVALFLHDVSSVVFITAWWALDLLARYGIMAGVHNRTTASLRLIGNNSSGDRQMHEPAVEMKFPKKNIRFDYNAGQFVQIAIPKLSIFEFHPLTISSAPHEDMVTLHVRKLGDWTSRLVELAQQQAETEIWIEGPYGSVQVDLEDDERYRTVLLVSGGIGVTPCQSIGKMLLHQHQVYGRNLRMMQFVWAVRDPQMVQDIPPLGGEADYSVNSKVWNQPRTNSVEVGSLGDWNIPSGKELPSTGSSSITTLPAHYRRPARVQVDIYCTRNNHSDAEQDPALPYNLHQGRPDLDVIFERMKAQAVEMGECNIAVIGCGPEALMSQLHEACRKHSSSVVGCGGDEKSRVFFDLHREFFDF